MTYNQGMKVLVTGGHPAPALAFIDALRASSEHGQTELVFVGRKFNNEREQTHSYEFKEVEKLGITFIHLKTGRLTRLISLRTLKSLIDVPLGFLRAAAIIAAEKPDRVVTFGGYIALPVAYAAWTKGIPVSIHEQTIHPGLATRLIARIAKNIFLSFPQSARYFPGRKVQVTGNLLRTHLFSHTKKPFDFPLDKPLIYITGGSLGSHSLNVHIEKILTNLIPQYTIIHQTGNVAEYNDYTRLKKLRNNLSPELQKRYYPVEHLSAEEVGYCYSHAELVISRSGANTIFELIALKKPAILVPLPWSAHNEQEEQAKLLQKAGVAEIFHQNETSQQLLYTINHMLNNRDMYQSSFTNLTELYREDAAELVVQTVF